MSAAWLLLFLPMAQDDESAAARALRFLARHQAEDGSWGRFETSCRCRSLVPLETPLALAVDEQVERRFQPLFEQLASDAIVAREKAQQEIHRLGAPVVPLLQRHLRHSDPEIALRCRGTLAALWNSDLDLRARWTGLGPAVGEDFPVTATGLAILCYLEMGYTHLSKDQVVDPDGRAYGYGQVVKRAVKWLMQRQSPDGAFSVRNPLAQAIAATAMSELYGMTAAQVLRDPAISGIAFLKTMTSSDLDFLAWAGIAFQSAQTSGLPDSTPGPGEQILQVLATRESPSAAAGSLFLAVWRKKATEGLKKKVSALRVKDLSPAESWLAITAVHAAWGHPSAELSAWREQVWSILPPTQVRSGGCDHGSWSRHGHGREDRLITTMYAALTMARLCARSCNHRVPVRKQG